MGSEECAYPKAAGNMVVESRCYEHGYRLKCGCNNSFNWVPKGANSHTVNGKDKAVCPQCHTIWSESAALVSKTLISFYKVEIDGDFLGGFEARSQHEALTIASHMVFPLRYKSFELTQIDEEEFNRLMKETAERNREHAAELSLSMLAAAFMKGKER